MGRHLVQLYSVGDIYSIARWIFSSDTCDNNQVKLSNTCLSPVLMKVSPTEYNLWENLSDVLKITL